MCYRNMLSFITFANKKHFCLNGHADYMADITKTKEQNRKDYGIEPNV